MLAYLLIFASAVGLHVGAVESGAVKEPVLSHIDKAPSLSSPSRQPTPLPSITGEQQIFALVGGAHCAEGLYYGPQAVPEPNLSDDFDQQYNYPFFLSTRTQSAAVPHTQWLQVVTSSEVERFRIYWNFRTAKTIAHRFADAVAVGEVVDYQIYIANSDRTVNMTGNWRFSSSSQITSETFDVAGVSYPFSADDGAWGAGQGIIDGNDLFQPSSRFWGIGNFDNDDYPNCNDVYEDGERSTQYNIKVYMYYFAPLVPSAAPTIASPTTPPTVFPTLPTTVFPTYTRRSARPTTQPTAVSTAAPTVIPTAAPSVDGVQQLFAVIGGNAEYASCVRSLVYGPQAITESGSADGQHPYYFSTGTASMRVPHTNWLQVVTTEGAHGTEELFRIYWNFETPMMIRDRFYYAGQPYELYVSYRIEVFRSKQTLYKKAWWTFDFAGLSYMYFGDRQDRCCLCANRGAWGASDVIVDDSNEGAAARGNFWGIGNFGSGRDDTGTCNQVYINGVVDTNITNVKAYMYYFAPIPPTALPTTSPTAKPIAPTVVPTTAPTTVKPTAEPSTRRPTRAPSCRPTYHPIPVPTVLPTAQPSTEPTFGGPEVYELFAVLTGYTCANLLSYGPSAITMEGKEGQFHYYYDHDYLSTGTKYRDIAHTEWLQVVTSDISTKSELFRIYWTFATPRTLQDHFTTAVSVGEDVRSRVVCNSTEYLYQGVWRFSSGAGNLANKFTGIEPTTSTLQFSAHGGMWGAGNGTIDGNYQLNMTALQFWGIGSYSGSDYSWCQYVYQRGVPTALRSQTTYMYYHTEHTADPSALPTMSPSLVPVARPTTMPSPIITMQPTPLPTATPTMRPTLLPTAMPTPVLTPVPTAKPTFQPTYAPRYVPIPSQFVLFAVLNGANCAQDLRYGPAAITRAGSADGYQAYLSTNTSHKDVPHREWLQIVTSDGVKEVFRIYWKFAVPRTLADHFIRAVEYGDVVDYRIVRPPPYETIQYNGTYWSFSSEARDMAAKFATPVTQTGFSDANGLWGGGSYSVDGASHAATRFWGVGNWYFYSNFGLYGSDAQRCPYYIWGELYHTREPLIKTYMYYSNFDDTPSALPTAGPSTTPTAPPVIRPTLAPVPPTAAPTTRRPTTAPSVVGPNYVLFAVLTDRSCAATLPYGPSALTTSGLADGNTAYLSTNTPDKDALHDEWVQETSYGNLDGNNNVVRVEVQRIHWKFDTPRTLADHFIQAVQTGVKVTFHVEDSTDPFTDPINGTWRFSSAAGDMRAKFATTTTRVGFSDAYGLWAAKSGAIDGMREVNPYPPTHNFWGVGTWRTPESRSSDAECQYVVRPSAYYAYMDLMRTYLYYTVPVVPVASLTLAPTVDPSTLLTDLPSVNPTCSPSTLPTALPMDLPSTSPTILPSIVPTELPTELPTDIPTDIPTAVPTPLPSTVPTTQLTESPTLQPNAVPIASISLQAEQRIDGVSFAAYTSHKSACDRVFIATIAASIGASHDSVKGLVVGDAAATTGTVPQVHAAPTNLRAVSKGTTSDGLSLQYTIQVPASSGVTYEQLSNQLTTSVQNGQFATQMQQYATEQDVPELATASTTSIETQDTTPLVEAPNNDRLSAAAVAGIVIAVLAVSLLCIFVAFRVYVQRAPERSGFQDLNHPRGGKGLFASTWVSSPMHQEPDEQ